MNNDGLFGKLVSIDGDDIRINGRDYGDGQWHDVVGNVFNVTSGINISANYHFKWTMNGFATLIRLPSAFIVLGVNTDRIVIRFTRAAIPSLGLLPRLCNATTIFSNTSTVAGPAAVAYDPAGSPLADIIIANPNTVVWATNISLLENLIEIPL